MLWVKTLDNPGSVDVHLVTSDWNEMDVTWNTRPSSTFVKTVEVRDAGQYIYIDITAQARAWINEMNAVSGECSGNKSTNFGIMLSQNTAWPARAEFDTKASGGIVPVLDVTLFDHSPGVPGAQGP